MIKTTRPLGAGDQKNYRLAFMVISTAVLIIMPLISHSYGQSGDEWLQLIYGDHIWNYFVHGDKQALDYSQMSLQYQKQEFYGGGFDFPMSVLHHWFPSIPILDIRHFFNALLGALMMVFTGLLAARLSKKWSVGLIALLFIIFSPRIFGESMNNPKDIPFASGFIIGIYFLIAYLQDFPKRKWKHLAGLMLGWGLAFSVRAAGGFLMLGYFFVFTVLYLLLQKEARKALMADGNRQLKKMFLFLALGIVAGYALALLTWPWGLQSPLSNPLKSISEMTNRETNIRVLFEGTYRWAHNMPWYYEFKWIFISNPLIVLAGVILFVLLAWQVRKQYGNYVVIILAFGAVFPLLYMMYKHSTVYDSWRHVFFVYQFWVIAGAFGIDAIGRFIKKPSLGWVPAAIAVVGLLPAIVWTVRSHPNQYVYFNALVGGEKGAYGYYDLDYYQNSGKQAADWILQNAKPVPGRKIIVLSNMGGFDKYFAKDTSWLKSDYGRYNERHHQDWDYYVTYPRFISAEALQNDKWPPQNVVHRVAVDGVTLCAVIQRKSRDGIAANEAFEKKDYATAAQKYADYIKTDTTDEFVWLNYAISLASVNRLDESVEAAKKAIAIDPSRPEYYQLLAQLYQAKGDNGAAQQAAQQGQSLMMQEQDDTE